MKTFEKGKILLGFFAISLIAILLIVLTSYSAELKYENNRISATNEAIQGEIDTLDIKIKSANNIENIEKIASEKLGMVYPSQDECIYIEDEEAPRKDFAMLIRERAYN